MKRVKILYATNHDQLEKDIHKLACQHNLTSIRVFNGPGQTLLGLYAECQWEQREFQTDEDQAKIDSLIEYALDATNDMLQMHKDGAINATEVINAYERHRDAIDQLARAGLYEWEPGAREAIDEQINQLKEEAE